MIPALIVFIVQLLVVRLSGSPLFVSIITGRDFSVAPVCDMIVPISAIHTDGEGESHAAVL